MPDSVTIGLPEIRREGCDVGTRQTALGGAFAPGAHEPMQERIDHEDATQLVEVVELSKGKESAWQSFVESHHHAGFFHRLEWRDAVAASFPHRSVYLCALRGSSLVGVLPMFEIRSAFSGSALVSVPYGVGGGVAAVDEPARVALLGAAKRRAKELRCKAIELRSPAAMFPDLPTLDDHCGFQRELPNQPEDVAGWLPRKARAVVRLAQDRYRLRVRYGDEHLSTLWDLYAQNMRRLASIAYPQRFFASLLTTTPDRHWIAVVFLGDKPIAGAAVFLFRGSVMPYFFGADETSRSVGAANYLYYELMRRGVAEGYRTFDFGRTRRSNRGSFDFKRFQGFEPTPLGYQRIPLRLSAGESIKPDDRRFRLARAIWPRLPLPLTNWLGAKLAPHFPG